MDFEERGANICAVLERIASNYAGDSEETGPLKNAAYALHFVHAHQLAKQFLDWVAALDRPLTDEEIDHLKSLGLEPPTKSDT